MHLSGWALGFIADLASDRSGATVIEYALIAFLVSVGIGFALPEIGASFKEVVEQAGAGMDRAAEVAGEDDPIAARSP